MYTKQSWKKREVFEPEIITVLLFFCTTTNELDSAENVLLFFCTTTNELDSAESVLVPAVEKSI